MSGFEPWISGLGSDRQLRLNHGPRDASVFVKPNLRMALRSTFQKNQLMECRAAIRRFEPGTAGQEVRRLLLCYAVLFYLFVASLFAPIEECSLYRLSILVLTFLFFKQISLRFDLAKIRPMAVKLSIRFIRQFWSLGNWMAALFWLLSGQCQ